MLVIFYISCQTYFVCIIGVVSLEIKVGRVTNFLWWGGGTRKILNQPQVSTDLNVLCFIYAKFKSDIQPS